MTSNQGAELQKTSSAPTARLVDPIHATRPPAPSDVWDHRAYPTWRADIWKLIEDFADADVKKAFLNSPPKYVVCDDLSWLDDIVYAVRNQEIDSKALLSERLRKRYKALRAVHGTRTTNIPKFYHDGLLPMVPELLHAQAREIFLGGEFPELTESLLQQAIEAVGSDLREGRVWFEANEEMLIAQAGHYMLYGSEYVTAIAAHLLGNRDYRQVLKNYGKPTLFVCDVPLELISEGILREFAGGALESVFQELLDGPEFVADRWRGAGFYIRKPLTAEHLVGHYHPDVRRDPMR